MVYALDTNVIIELLNNKSCAKSGLDAAVSRKIAIVVPPFVHYEIQRGFHYIKSPKKEAAYHNLISYCPIGSMTTQAFEIAAKIYADLRKAGKTIGDADIMIAAFCVVNKYNLVTANTKHFTDINDLPLVDWTK